MDPDDIAAGTVTLDDAPLPPITVGHLLRHGRGHAPVVLSDTDPTWALLVHKREHEAFDGAQRMVSGVRTTVRSAPSDVTERADLPTRIKVELDDRESP